METDDPALTSFARFWRLPTLHSKLLFFATNQVLSKLMLVEREGQEDIIKHLYKSQPLDNWMKLERNNPNLDRLKLYYDAITHLHTSSENEQDLVMNERGRLSGLLYDFPNLSTISMPYYNIKIIRKDVVDKIPATAFSRPHITVIISRETPDSEEEIATYTNISGGHHDWSPLWDVQYRLKLSCGAEHEWNERYYPVRPEYAIAYSKELFSRWKSQEGSYENEIAAIEVRRPVDTRMLVDALQTSSGSTIRHLRELSVELCDNRVADLVQACNGQIPNLDITSCPSPPTLPEVFNMLCGMNLSRFERLTLPVAHDLSTLTAPLTQQDLEWKDAPQNTKGSGLQHLTLKFINLPRSLTLAILHDRTSGFDFCKAYAKSLLAIGGPNCKYRLVFYEDGEYSKSAEDIEVELSLGVKLREELDMAVAEAIASVRNGREAGWRKIGTGSSDR